MGRRLNGYVPIHNEDGTTSWYGPDDAIPGDVASKIGDHAWIDDDQAEDLVVAATVDGPFDPAEHNVDDVNAYLAEADDDERARVLTVEGADAGKQRAGVLTGPYAAE